MVMIYFLGYHEAQKDAYSVLEDPNLSICTKKVSIPHNKNEKEDSMLNSIHANFLVHCDISPNHSSIIESLNTSTISNTKSKNLSTKHMQMMSLIVQMI